MGQKLKDFKCCNRCWHSEEKACTQFVECLHTGPLCHDDDKCAEKRREIISTLRREKAETLTIYVGAGTCGLGAGAGKTIEAVKAYLVENSIEAELIEVGCAGMCFYEPMLDVQVQGRCRVSFKDVTGDKVSGLLDSILAGDIPADMVIGQFRPYNEQVKEYEGVGYIDEHPFIVKQTRWVLSNCGVIDPGSIDAYISRGGYCAQEMALREHTPEELCDIVEKSGLRGRGGGGFLTGKKWKFAAGATASQKYLICNADEGDPGAFMDRAVIEGDPHRLLEGLAIAAYAIGASKAYVYIRAEYPLAIERLKKAIAQAKEYGLLGHNILDSGFNLEIMIKMGAGAFVCGEETALIHSIEGKRGMPRPRPPYPAIKGLFGKPTIINNVETLANLARIIDKGWKKFAQVGTGNSKGTKVFALSGKVVRTGLVEVAMGTKLREIVFDIGGGIFEGGQYKAVQIGGPSGGCIPKQHLDIEIDYESLKTVGAMMGSGGLVVMDDKTCMVDVAKFFMNFIQRESCGKCIPCREGTKKMLDILEKITQSRKHEKGTDALERFKGVIYLNRLAEVIKDTSLCGLGQTAPNPVLSTLRWFRAEYEEHIYNRRCPAGVCKSLLSYTIDEDKCKGCTLCARECPVDAIVGSPRTAHYIVQDKCVGCGNCAEICKFGAVVVE